METAPLKSFATWARKELLREVTARIAVHADQRQGTVAGEALRMRAPYRFPQRLDFLRHALRIEQERKLQERMVKLHRMAPKSGATF